VLLERPGELVSKQELMGRVWPRIFVEPANLTVHMSALRRTLHDGHDGNRFIINVPGRGYSFVASVEVLGPRIERERPSRGLNEPAVALPDLRLSMSGKRKVAVITDPVGPNRQHS
jgi:DNA-binding winged helix-turn-helix (wHTH) protein